MSATTLTDLDYALNVAHVEIDTTLARAELAALRARVAMLDDYAATIRAHEITIEDQARQIAELTAERDAFAEINDGIHRAVNEMCGTDTSTIEAVKGVIDKCDTQAKQIAWLTNDAGESGLAAINRLVAACERGDIAQQAAPDIQAARDEIVRQARQLEQGREAITAAMDYLESMEYSGCYQLLLSWYSALAATEPAPEAADIRNAVSDAWNAVNQPEAERE